MSSDEESIYNHYDDSDNDYDPNYSVDVSGWTNGEDSESHQKRSDIIHQMLKHQCLKQLRTRVESGWDVNEELIGHNPHVPLLYAIIHSKNYVKLLVIVQLLLEHGANPNVAHTVNIARHGDTKCVQRTALHEALRLGWPELVKMLIDAGATFTTADWSENPLVLALQKHDCPTDLLKLLLKNSVDPNGHDDQTKNIPLLKTIRNCKKHYCCDEDYNQEKTLNVKVLLDHGANPNVAHSVNIGGCEEATWVDRTAIDEAATLGLVDVVKLLLDAGAKCTTSLKIQMGLMLRNTGCHPDLIELMLKHGADPNHIEKDEGTPLLCAITNVENKLHLKRIIELLLAHGANPHVAHNLRIGYKKDIDVHTTPLHEAARCGLTDVVKLLLDAGAKCVTPDTTVNPLTKGLKRYECCADLMEMLLNHGADLHYVETVYRMDRPLLHSLAQKSSDCRPVFPQREFDLVFLHGGNINTEDAEQRTVLEYALHSHSVRWLIRHGADTALPVTRIMLDHLMPNQWSQFPEIPLVLLQAGMRVSYRAQTQLSNMEMAISVWLQGDDEDDENLLVTIESIWNQIEEAEEEIPPRAQHKKSTFPEYFSRQMADLQKFSDESLQLYPDKTYISFIDDTRQDYKNILDQIQEVLEFLSQPQSLQWYCRCCVRENLMSLQPSVIKTLHVPAILKRYILCHEI